MKTMAILLVFGTLAHAAEPRAVGPVELKEVTMVELDKAVASNKGKVVVIDLWFLGCAPCVKKFPQLVNHHKALGKDGLVCMSLNVEPEELKKQDKVLEFLKKQEADFPNFIVKDDEKNRDKWQEKYDANGTPSYVVFDRTGKFVPVPDEIKTESDMKQFLQKLLEAK